MPFILTPPQIVILGDVTTYLSANYVDRGSLYGATLIKPPPPVQILFVTDALRWGIEGGAETDQSLRFVANYLYWMCGRFQLEAQMILNSLGGGSVVPTPASQSTLPNPYDWIVTTFTSATMPLKEGDSSVTLDRFKGFNIEYTRGGITQNTSTFGDQTSYFQWNRDSGVFRIFPAAVAGEIMRILPAGPGSSPGTSDETEVTRSIQYTAVGGETSFFNSAIENSTIVAVERGTPYTLIYTGAPATLESLVTLNVDNLSDGNIAFSDDNPLNAEEVVTVIYSISI